MHISKFCNPVDSILKRVKRYKKILIFYFTGTGNSGKVAEWIAKVAFFLKKICKNILFQKIFSNFAK
jgi:hypothetical protein